MEIIVGTQAAWGRVGTMLDECDSVSATRLSKKAALQMIQSA